MPRLSPTYQNDQKKLEMHHCVRINLIGWKSKYENSILVSKRKEQSCNPNKGDHDRKKVPGI
eukprot:5456332-Ditylum_brightwellii.AAC.1